MEFSPFGRQENNLNTNQRMEVVISSDEIMNLLAISEHKYANALEDLRAGNKNDLDYLIEMQANLLAWKEKFKEIGVADMHDEEVSRQVNARLYELSEEFEKLEESK